MNDYETLPEVVHPKGTGIRNLTAKLISRKGNICMYERSDHVYEVFKVHIRGETVFPSGTKTPRMEIYPGNDDFGNTAWCCGNRERAETRYNELIASGVCANLHIGDKTQKQWRSTTLSYNRSTGL